MNIEFLKIRLPKSYQVLQNLLAHDTSEEGKAFFQEVLSNVSDVLSGKKELVSTITELKRKARGDASRNTLMVAEDRLREECSPHFEWENPLLKTARLEAKNAKGSLSVLEAELLSYQKQEAELRAHSDAQLADLESAKLTKVSHLYERKAEIERLASLPKSEITSRTIKELESSHSLIEFQLTEYPKKEAALKAHLESKLALLEEGKLSKIARLDETRAALKRAEEKVSQCEQQEKALRTQDNSFRYSQQRAQQSVNDKAYQEREAEKKAKEQEESNRKLRAQQEQEKNKARYQDFLKEKGLA
jgi:hypothetical protein